MSDARCSRSIEKRPMCQSFSWCSIVVCNSTLMGLLIAEPHSRRALRGTFPCGAVVVARAQLLDDPENLLGRQHDGVFRLLDDRTPVTGRVDPGLNRTFDSGTHGTSWDGGRAYVPRHAPVVCCGALTRMLS